jgi:hypothetical protein
MGIKAASAFEELTPRFTQFSEVFQEFKIQMKNELINNDEDEEHK